jgi:hypothetical protein
MDSIVGLFEEKTAVNKIRTKLPELFQLAEIESSRAGKLGMEVGSVRERIMIALLKSVYGDKAVDTNTPITEAETDVLLFDKPISIKTVTGKILNGVKLIWTVDPQKALLFSKNYRPSCDILLVQICWNSKGNLFLITKDVQTKILKKIGRERYIKLPKQGTNPRGVELSKEALELLTKDLETKRIEIDWNRSVSTHDIYQKWVDLWK